MFMSFTLILILIIIFLIFRCWKFQLNLKNCHFFNGTLPIPTVDILETGLYNFVIYNLIKLYELYSVCDFTFCKLVQFTVRISHRKPSFIKTICSVGNFIQSCIIILEYREGRGSTYCQGRKQDFSQGLGYKIL